MIQNIYLGVRSPLQHPPPIGGHCFPKFVLEVFFSSTFPKAQSCLNFLIDTLFKVHISIFYNTMCLYGGEKGGQLVQVGVTLEVPFLVSGIVFFPGCVEVGCRVGC